MKRDDPVLGFNFQISLIDATSSMAAPVTTVALSSVVDRPAGGFSECTGLDGALEVEDYMEGGNNAGVLRFPTRIKWEPLRLKRGLTTNTELWDWYYGFAEGRTARKDGVIVVRGSDGRPHTVWGFRRGLPIKYSGPQLNASQNQVAIVSLEIAHEGLYQMPGASGLANAVSDAANAIGSLF